LEGEAGGEAGGEEGGEADGVESGVTDGAASGVVDGEADGEASSRDNNRKDQLLSSIINTRRTILANGNYLNLFLITHTLYESFDARVEILC